MANKNDTRMLLQWLVAGLALGLIASFGLSTKEIVDPEYNKKPLEPLTAEQLPVSEPQTATIGDIVEVNPGFQGIQSRHWVIKGEDPQQRGTFMSPITQGGYIGMTKYVSWKEFAEESPRVVQIRDEEWALILRLYMGPDNVTLAPICDSQYQVNWNMLFFVALNDTIDDDWVKPDRPDSLSE